MSSSRHCEHPLILPTCISFSQLLLLPGGGSGADLLDYMPSGKGYIDASTVSTTACQQIAEEVHRTGARFLEAPVSGSKQPAEQGTLIFLAAGVLTGLQGHCPTPCVLAVTLDQKKESRGPI